MDDEVIQKLLNKLQLRQWTDIRNQLRVNMTGLEEHIGAGYQTVFQRTYGIPRERVKALESDQWHELSRPYICELLRLERQVQQKNQEHNGKAFKLFSEEPNPFWETFGDYAVGFKGRNLAKDRLDVDVGFTWVFTRAGIELKDASPDKPVHELMTSENCVFIGSPKTNDATERALEALFPSDKPQSVRFFWPDWSTGRRETRVSGRGGYQIDYRYAADKEVIRVRQQDSAKPIALVVLCRQPFGTKANVTTIIIAGSTRHGSAAALYDVLSGDLHVPQSQVKPGEPIVLILGPQARGNKWINIAGDHVQKEKRQKRRDIARRKTAPTSSHYGEEPAVWAASPAFAESNNPMKSGLEVGDQPDTPASRQDRPSAEGKRSRGVDPDEISNARPKTRPQPSSAKARRRTRRRRT